MLINKTAVYDVTVIYALHLHLKKLPPQTQVVAVNYIRKLQLQITVKS